MLTEEDALNSNWYGWFNSAETTYHMQKHYYPNSREAQLDFFNSMVKDKTKIQLGIISKKENVLIGCVSLNNINYINSNAEISVIIGEKEHRDLLKSLESMKLMIEFAFEQLNLNKVYCGVLETLSTNWKKLLMKRLNFHEEGIFFKHAYKNGRYQDVHFLGVFKEEYNKK
jgi:RimJ/RimL family protein N-acetyltransferase